MELLKGGKGVGQLARERGMSEALIYRWRDQALKAIEGAFKGNGGKSGSGFTGERDRLLKIIGEQACVIETLKKIRRCAECRSQAHHCYGAQKIDEIGKGAGIHELEQEQLLL